MPYLRSTVIILCLSFLQSYCYAQEKSKAAFGHVVPGDFTLPVIAIIDSNSNAAILSDIGDVHFVGNKQGWFSYVYKRQTRIKIINKKAFDLATVRIPLYEKNDDAEKVNNLAGSTYNLEDGKVVETKLDKNEVFEEQTDKNHLEKKFTMPAVKEGSIIEYTYTITSDYNFNLPSWEFQSVNYPCFWSEYNVNIPQTLSYVFIRHGVHAFNIDKGSTGSQSYMVTEKNDNRALGAQDQELSVSANTVIHRWAMKEIPAFHVENYISAPWNYTDRIEFQLSGTYNGQDKQDVMNTWAKATEDLLKQEDFGLPLRDDNGWLNGLPDKITAGIDAPLDQAKAIYYYVNSHFTCTDHYNPFIKTTLKDVFKKNNGTIGELNLLLIAMLRQKGIRADPVLLSTRNMGFNSSTYPMMERLRYMVVRVSIGGKVYYLDGSHSQLGFGQLPAYCYNGHARIISNKDSGSVYFRADSLKETKTTMVMISMDSAGRLVGTWQSQLGDQESYNTREKVSETSEKKYFESIQTSYGEDAGISNTSIDSLHLPENPVTIHYDFTMRQEPGTTLIYFDPLFGEELRKNPFSAAERQYPVEMPYAMDDIYLLNMDIPEGYDVDELPKSAKVILNVDEGSFEYLIDKQGSMIQLRCRVKLNLAHFPAEDYNSLRDFFAFIAKKESETIVLKKK